MSISQEHLVRETFKKMMKALGPAKEADMCACGEELVLDMEKLVPQPDEMPEFAYGELIERCQQLTELRKTQIKLEDESVAEILDECEYIDGSETENYLTIKIDENAFIEDTIKLALDHFSD